MVTKTLATSPKTPDRQTLAAQALHCPYTLDCVPPPAGPDARGLIGGPSRSAIVRDTAAGYHLLDVNCYSRTTEEFRTGRYIKSYPFSVGGVSWRISCYPNGDKPESAEFISVYLRLDQNVVEPVKARGKFSLLDQMGKPVQSHSLATALHEFSTVGFGFQKFIKRAWLEDSEHLKDDRFTVRCDVMALKEIHTVERRAASSLVAVPLSDLNQHLGNLLASKDGADITFQVAGETIKAHRYILTARSPVFKAQLTGAMREGTTSGDSCIQIDDMLAEVFHALLHFIYTDSLPEMDRKEELVMAQHLLEAADRYDMQRLKRICEDKLGRYLDVTTAATTLVLAEQHHCHGLKEAFIEFLKSRNVLEAVMETDGFDHLTKSCLVKELMSKLAARWY